MRIVAQTSDTVVLGPDDAYDRAFAVVGAIGLGTLGISLPVLGVVFNRPDFLLALVLLLVAWRVLLEGLDVEITRSPFAVCRRYRHWKIMRRVIAEPNSIVLITRKVGKGGSHRFEIHGQAAASSTLVVQADHVFGRPAVALERGRPIAEAIAHLLGCRIEERL